ncbi:RloB family protein [Sphingomonas sp. OK281]|uniref:RloB family protein n=1 Tax=Sphingomonas sp. OK281 TaxID=1881067 RepID=UPI000B8845DC|nr:RloB family protein [Sphingomonas sp. OK281]
MIVCEGEKTERIYFSLFATALRAANVQLEIPPRECGTDPKSFITFGMTKFDDDVGIDRCFCIIDRDSHANFDEAMDYASTFIGRVQIPRAFDVIVSYPSFEYWLLMHYVRTTKPFSKSGKKSPGDMVVAELKKHLPNYAKNAIDPMKALFDKTTVAIENAESTYKAASSSGNMNPSTRVHLVVSLIMNLIKGDLDQVLPKELQG